MGISPWSLQAISKQGQHNFFKNFYLSFSLTFKFAKTDVTAEPSSTLSKSGWFLFFPKTSCKRREGVFSLKTNFISTTKDINCLSVTWSTIARKGIVGLLFEIGVETVSWLMQYTLKNGIWRPSVYLYGIWPRYQMICYYVDVYFLTMKASSSQPGQYFPISEFLVQQ